MELIELLIKFTKEQRKYASYFDWFRKEKAIKEVGIVKTLIQSVRNSSLSKLSNVKTTKKDPPDCVAVNQNGSKIGFEVRELVDQKAIEENQKNEHVYREWEIHDAIKEIEKIIIEKDSKTYHDGPYQELILVIHIAEPFLTLEYLQETIKSHTFNKPNQITGAFLLFQYDPASKCHPNIKLKFG